MHFYNHNIGDFNNSTRHLTRVERSLYRDLIELYYDSEQPLQSVDFNRLAKRVLAQTEEELTALAYVLSDFFQDFDNNYNHARCDAEIAKYHTNTSAKAKAGIASAKARQAKKQQDSTDDEQVLNVCATKQEIGNKKQETITKKKRTPAAIEIPEWLDSILLNDFIDSRKANKKPMTQKAISLLINKITRERDNGHDASQMLEDAIVGGWQSVYPKDKPKKTNGIVINHSGYNEKQIKNQNVTAAVLDIDNTDW